MRRPLLRVVSLPALLLVALGGGGCGGEPLCDLERGPLGMRVDLTSPLSAYDAVLETSERWLVPLRPVDPETGEDLDGLTLEPAVEPAVTMTLSCRDGEVVEHDGAAPPSALSCDDGFPFLHDNGALVPAEVRVRLTFPDSAGERVEPEEGFASVEYRAVVDEPGCPVRGYAGELVVDTDGV